MPRFRFAAGKLPPRRRTVPRTTVGVLAPLRRFPAPPGEAGRVGRAKQRNPNAPVPFLVGRISRGNRGMMVLDEATPPPIPGPWELKAVFSKDRPVAAKSTALPGSENTS